MTSLSRRTDAQTARRAAVEARVLGSAERLLGEGASYAGLSVDRIATEAGISRPAFYFYFRDKRELLMRLTEDVADRLYAQAESWWTAEEADGPAALAEALAAVIELYRSHGVLPRAVVEASTYDGEIAVFWRAVIARFADATQARIEAEQAAGRAAGLDAAGTASALAWMTERTVYEHMVGEPGDDDALVRSLVGIWVRTVYSG